MTTFDQLDESGRLQSFEVETSDVRRYGLVSVVKTIPGATIIRKPMMLFTWFREHQFYEFAVGGQRFVADEPFGDNSRYWIGPIPPGLYPETIAVRDAFRSW